MNLGDLSRFFLLLSIKIFKKNKQSIWHSSMFVCTWVYNMVACLFNNKRQPDLFWNMAYEIHYLEYLYCQPAGNGDTQSCHSFWLLSTFDERIHFTLTTPIHFLKSRSIPDTRSLVTCSGRNLLDHRRQEGRLVFLTAHAHPSKTVFSLNCRFKQWRATRTVMSSITANYNMSAPN